MSILLVVMLILAVIHYFYQSTVVRSNNELQEADLAILQHEVEIFGIKNSKALNVSEVEFLKETKDFVKQCPKISKRFTLLEMLLEMAEFQNSKEYEDESKEIRALKIQNATIWKYNTAAARMMFRNATSNAGLFLIVLSPILILMLLYSLISGSKFSLDKSVERFTTRHC